MGTNELEKSTGVTREWQKCPKWYIYECHFFNGEFRKVNDTRGRVKRMGPTKQVSYRNKI
jgi:hypothetical protein